MPRGLGPLAYSAGWQRRWVKANGEITWRGIRRYVGEAFVQEHVGLKPMQSGKWNVYFGPLLIGQLLDEESGNIRMAQYRRQR